MSTQPQKTVTIWGLAKLLRLFNVVVSTDDILVGEGGPLPCPTSDTQLVSAVARAMYVLDVNAGDGGISDGNFRYRSRSTRPNPTTSQDPGPSNTDEGNELGEDEGGDGSDEITWDDVPHDDDDDNWSIERQIDLLGMTYEQYSEA